MNSQHPSSAPRDRQSWVLLTILFALSNFLGVSIVGHFLLFTPAFLQQIGFTQAEISAWTGPISSLAFLTGIWFVPLWGVLADRYGRKPLILRSYIVIAIAVALAAASQNLWLYVIARALSGLALGNTGLMFAALTETAPRERTALAVSLVNGSASMGPLIGGVAGGLIVAQFGVNALFGVDAVVALVIVVIQIFFYRDVFVPKATPRLRVMLREALHAITDSPVARTMFAVSFAANAAFFFAYPYLPVRIGEIVGAKEAPLAISWTQGAAGIATIVGSAFWGALADRLGHRRLLAFLLLAHTLFWIPNFLATDIVALATAWALLSFVSTSAASMIFAIISLNVPAEKRGSVLSMVFLPLNVAFIVAPSAASLVARALEVRDVFIAAAGLTALALAIFLANLGRTRQPAVPVEH